jgi:hypothetical protein
MLVTPSSNTPTTAVRNGSGNLELIGACRADRIREGSDSTLGSIGCWRLRGAIALQEFIPARCVGIFSLERMEEKD